MLEVPKSIPSPTNRAAKATEIGFSSPTMSRPSAAVTMRPAKVVTSTATMRRPERSASQRNRTMAATVTELLRSASSDRVENSSSAIAACPVRRTRTPFSGVRLRSRAVLRISAVATSAGWSAL